MKYTRHALFSHATASQLFGPKSAIRLNFYNKDESNDESSDIIKKKKKKRTLFKAHANWKEAAPAPATATAQDEKETAATFDPNRGEKLIQCWDTHV